MEKNRNKFLLILISIIGLGVAFVFAAGLGGASVHPYEILKSIKGAGNDIDTSIVMDMRLPRTLIGLFVGASLAVSGVLLQSVMRNPLGDPGITGVSSGASFFAILFMFYFPEMNSIIPLVAFGGAVIACIMVFVLSWKKGLETTRIILAGIAVNAIFMGGTTLLTFLNSTKVQGVMLWLNGSLAYRGWTEVKYLSIYATIGILVSLTCIKSANLLALGDDTAKSLGLNVNRARLFLSLVAVYLAGVSTAVVGVISFVGLIVPHICRLIMGTDHKYLLPMSAVWGAILVVVADTLARFAFRPIELPIGIVMAVIGGPFFLYLLKKRGRVQ